MRHVLCISHAYCSCMRDLYVPCGMGHVLFVQIAMYRFS